MADAQAFRDLLDVLSKVDRTKFDMGTWKCGTSACAMGYAAMDPRFQARGLQLTPPDSEGYCSVYNSQTDWEGSIACAHVMGISDTDAYHLFTSAAACRRSLEEEIEYIKNYCAKRNISLAE